MNLLADFFNFGAPPVPATPSYTAGMTDKIAIINAFNEYNAQYISANNFITDLTAKLSALETAVSGGTFATFAASRLQWSGPGANYMDVIHQHAAISYIGTSGPLLLTAATALYLTPVQTRLQNFTTAYQTTLHAAGLV